MKYVSRISVIIICIGVLFFLAACGPTVTPQTQQAPQQVTIDPNFQSQVSPIPTVPTYRCGAWSSNNAPGPYSTIAIYARLTKKGQPVAGATATATVHFQSGDVTLDAQPVSDEGGYVSFTLSLEGRQSAGNPATVDITFNNFPGGTVHCTPAFFTPQ